MSEKLVEKYFLLRHAVLINIQDPSFDLPTQVADILIPIQLLSKTEEGVKVEVRGCKP